MTVRRRVALPGVILALAACSSDLALAGGVDGPVIFSGANPDNSGNDAIVNGTMRLEGDCLYLAQDADGASQRFPVVWPAGTRWQADPAGVVLPSGDIALVGHSVEGAGGYQYPQDVTPLAGADGAALADRCADGPYREVAIFNLESDVDLIE